MSKPVRRVVTGHDVAGRAVIASDGPPSRVETLSNGVTFFEIWHTSQTPARIDRTSQAQEPKLLLAPPHNGTRIRVVEFPPEKDQKIDPQVAREHFAQIGAEASSTASAAGARHAYMHRTETIDYGIVLEGEIILIMDIGETKVQAGDIVVQRGTNHGWANRSGRICRVAFILIDGVFEEGLGAV
jgi:uncharacterized cupin superfamily protein